MEKLSPKDEKELINFIKDWLRNLGFSQKDLASKLNIKSSRTSEILKKLKGLYKRGGMYYIARDLIRIEQDWLNDKNYDNQISYNNNKIESKSYNQLDLEYKLDIDKLMDQMEKDHKNN